MNSKNQINELDQKIKKLLFYKKNIHKNSTTNKILKLLYTNKQLTIKQITSQINNDKPYNYIKKIILQMKSNGYLKCNDKKYGKSYYLSQIGRWFALCVILDHVSLQSLCVLSQVYCKVRKDPTNRMNYYMISKFRDSFDKSCDDDLSCASAVYSHVHILRSVKQLTDRNLVYFVNSDFLKISLPIFEKLQKYDQDFISLVEWQKNIIEKCRDEQLKVILSIPERKILFSSIKSLR
ncbi:hypothetical protein [Nitrosopumilus sp.]|uniref:hypothetical protein n=1 Tax=Nitrosopumilus sp. TaxID=2024843 RepID=UPI002930EF2F|nr:hypothetical protein [Nitrosopumilus sp.]